MAAQERKLSLRVVLTIVVGLTVVSLWGGAGSASGVTCDKQALGEAKQEFKRLLHLRQRAPSSLSNDEFRAISDSYIGHAERCYEALHGVSAPIGQMIDDGGLWAPESFRHSKVGQPGYRQYNLDGRKWGAGSPYLPIGDNPDAQGLRISGGSVSYSFMADGVDLSAESVSANPTDDPNTAIWSLANFESCFFVEITDAFAAWSAVADIEFQPLTDNGVAANAEGAQGDIRVGAHAIDGPGGTLAHGYFPPPNGNTIAGDLHFDEDEDWYCDPARIGGAEKDIGIVALHEIGHSLGLRHESTDPAAMEATYNPALSGIGLLADDIIGISEIYGPSPFSGSFFAGDLGIGTDHPQASIHVKRDDGTGKLLVQESSPVTAARDLLEISNSGNVSYTLRSTAPGALAYRFTSNSQGNLVVSAAGEQKLAVFNGGAVFMGRPPGGAFNFQLNTAGDLTIAGDLTANGIHYASDRNRKRDIREVDVKEVLEKVAQLPVTTWKFQSDDTPHMGPMAQDFYTAFGLGKDNRHLSPTDTAGVALAAIQGVYRELQEKDAEIAALRASQAEIEALRVELAEIRALLSRSADLLPTRPEMREMRSASNR